MLKIVLLSFVGLIVLTVAALGWRGQRSTRPPLQAFDDMVDQPKYKAQSESVYFADGRAMRLPPAHSRAYVPANAADDDQAAFAKAKIPLTVDETLMNRGQEVFSIYCAVCHGLAGESNGPTTHYGMSAPPKYWVDRLLKETDGYLYRVITEGKNTMPAYGPQIHPTDRWAAVAYVRALQHAAGGAAATTVPATTPTTTEGRP